MELQDWVSGQLSQDIWNNKYKFQDETFDQWLDRISNGNKAIRKLIAEKKFLFGGRILANRGLQNRGKKITYSNCYVIPAPEDNIESIFNTARDLARTFSYSGGCGIDISKLRPNGMKVHNAAETTTGSVSFMDLYSKVTELIGGNGRRGALMISILCTHPDILDFIDVKNDLNKVTKANISVRILDQFMEAVKNDRDWILYFDCGDTGDAIKKTVKARDIYHKICDNNWNMAEPGALFWDTICNWNLLSEDPEFEYAGTNPCAEEPLPAGGSCLLGSLNLSEFVIDPFTDNATFDYPSFLHAVRESVIALNEVLDEGLPLHPLQIQRDTVHDYRQIGLGIMGIGDMLIKLGIRYGSEKSLSLCDQIGLMMANKAIRTSAELAKEYGAYPKYKREAILKSQYLNYNVLAETMEHVRKYGLRNSQLLTIAPTGTLSTMLEITGGIEPIYAVSYTRKTESLHGKDVSYKVYTPIVKQLMEKLGLKEEEELPDTVVTAMNLNYRDRIDMQAIWQSHIDASISSTVNVPESFTIDEVKDLYMYAWEKRVKGVTIYRDNCKRSGILTVDAPKEEKSNELLRGQWKPKAEDTVYFERKVYIGCGKLKLMIGWSNKEQCIQDLYVIRSGQGGCERNLQGMVVAMSGMLRLGGNIFNIEKAFEGMGSCNSFTSKRVKNEKLSKGGSCGCAILYAIKDFLSLQHPNTLGFEEHAIKPKNGDVKLSEEEIDYLKKNGEILFYQKYNKCPQCGDKLDNSGGCVTCTSCGWSKCS